MSQKITQCVERMLELQEAMNHKVHPQWRTQGYEWYRAIWVECAELMDHYGWKWWKNQPSDMEQVKLEIIDIWHFGLSFLLSRSEVDNHQLAQQITAELIHGGKPAEFRGALESFTEWTLVNRGFSVREFASLMAAADLSFEALYQGYIGKNVLNFFRQDHGYKDGTYIKIWSGKEDNEHLIEICDQLDITSVTFQEDIYHHLKRRYTALTIPG